MTFNDRATPLSLLQTRRSGKPRDMVAPGPSLEQLHAIVAIAARTPDHGKLAPWRFVIVPDEARPALALRLVEIQRAEKPDCNARDEEATAQFVTQAPALIVVLSAAVPGHKIPEWEQQLSAGAACMNLLHAAHAMGFVGSWLTGWAAYSEQVRDLFGAAPQRIAGFVFIGTPGRELEERPRGKLSEIVHEWNPGYGPDR
ncbi:nitroreductase family protein [Sphingomonas psychrotolerans]|uniref:Putative NAD(P)H nitroreductase n=1 Tax=Sphingomonas psychrotolerans TaxID=1327635 RepID=A0A2K8MKX9_9SPHN|nr:nitroreductase [Sphingomonas psychrotolerans]ATY33664.1 nitroreductase [Sphingomonas psychrotolerans]